MAKSRSLTRETMAYILSSIPYFRCLVRREFTQDLQEGHGEYIEAVAYGVRCIRGHSLWFQTMLVEPHGGASFMVPIQALTTKPVPPPEQTLIQPWDVFSSDFGVHAFDLVKHGKVEVLPSRSPGRYKFSLDFTGSDLADDPEQHKHLHVVELDDGQIGAFPNNRMLWSDPAFWNLTTEKPSFKSLSMEFRAE